MMLCHRKIRTGLALIAAMVLWGCASQENASDIDEDELHTLPGRFADEPLIEPLVAVEAYIGKDEFFLAYEGPDGLVYSGGNWSNRIDLNVAGVLRTKKIVVHFRRSRGPDIDAACGQLRRRESGNSPAQ